MMEKDKCCNFYGSQCEKYLLYYGEGIFYPNRRNPPLASAMGVYGGLDNRYLILYSKLGGFIYDRSVIRKIQQ